MINRIPGWCIPLLAFVLCSSASHAAAQEGTLPQQLSVKVSKAKLFEAPKFWAKTIGDTQYGDTLNALEQSGAWFKVESDLGIQGFVHDSTVTNKRIVFVDESKANSSKDSTRLAQNNSGIDINTDAVPERVDVSQDEIVMAGKGWNKDVEGTHKENNQDLNYPAVDRIEQRNVSSEELAQFLEQGKLNL